MKSSLKLNKGTDPGKMKMDEGQAWGLYGELLLWGWGKTEGLGWAGEGRSSRWAAREVKEGCCSLCPRWCSFHLCQV